MGLFQRGFFRSLLFTTLGISAILTLMIWLAQSLSFASLFAQQSTTLKEILGLFSSLFPRIVLVTVPAAFLLAMLWEFHRLFRDHEHDALSSCGASPWFFAWPCVVLSLGMTAALFAVSLLLVPMAARFSKETHYRTRHHLDPSFLTPGVFFQIDGRTFYVHKQKTKQHFEGIMIYDGKNPKNIRVLTGQMAAIHPKEEGMELTIHDGTQHIYKHSKAPSVLMFKKYTFQFLPGKAKLRKKHEEERSLQELRHPSSEKEARDFNKEMSKRFFLPLMPLIISLGLSWILLFLGRSLWMSLLGVVLASGLYRLVFWPFGLGSLFPLWISLGLWIYSYGMRIKPQPKT
jgi:lipopolysaccharide export LptBFGC system permease protein LptF